MTKPPSLNAAGNSRSVSPALASRLDSNANSSQPVLPTSPTAPAVSIGDAVPDREAARILGVSVKTLSNWRWRQIGPPYLKYTGRHGSVRYLLSDLAAWQQAHRRSGS